MAQESVGKVLVADLLLGSTGNLFRALIVLERQNHLNDFLDKVPWIGWPLVAGHYSVGETLRRDEFVELHEELVFGQHLLIEEASTEGITGISPKPLLAHRPGLD